MLKEAFCILKTATDKPPPTQMNEQNPELRSFFDFIIEKMKNYNNQTKNSVQHEIFQIIVRADQGYYDVPEGYYSQSANNSVQEGPCKSSIATTSTSTSLTQANSPSSSAHDFSTENYFSSPASAYSDVDLEEKYSI